MTAPTTFVSLVPGRGYIAFGLAFGLAVALALRALEEGYTAYFTTLDRLVTDFQRAKANHTLERRFRVYLKPKVLVLDEIGYLPLDRSDANLLFQLVSERYESGRIILTSNKSCDDWASFRRSRTGNGIFDRLLHHFRYGQYPWRQLPPT